jgi:hypothetical protein
VEILLLDVTGLALKSGIPFAAVDEHLTAHNTHSDTRSEDIEKCSLSGSGNTLFMEIRY